ncbi:MAG: DUF4258 domain-containing protein [Alkalinema sp. RU_4_3]|nr:DUF4258 domain-containing protein [Alkalinema sp. RU_4_3]
MFFRGISERDVEVAIAHGEMIESYPDDQPFPSMLILDFVRGMALHIVISQDPGSESCTVVTAYIPDKTQWMASFKTRR